MSIRLEKRRDWESREGEREVGVKKWAQIGSIK